MLLQEIIKCINKEADANQASAFIIIKISSICPSILKSSLIRHGWNLGENWQITNKIVNNIINWVMNI